MSDNKTQNIPSQASEQDEHINETIRQIEELAEPQEGVLKGSASPSLDIPLIINRIKKNKDTGGYDITLALDNTQVYVLLNFAIMFLTSQGLAQFADQEAVEEATEAPKEEVVLGSQIH